MYTKLANREHIAVVMYTRKNKRVNPELLARWQDRVQSIRCNEFELRETREEQELRIKRAKRDYGFFVSSYFSHIAPKPCGKFQIQAANYVADNPRAYALFEWARGHAKSTHLGCLIPLWLLARDKASFRYLVVIGKSEDDAKGLLADLQAELSQNKRYNEDFGIGASEAAEWQNGRFVASNGTIFVAKGRGQSPRGMKRKGARPDYIVMDDIDDDELCRNPSRVKKVVDWIRGALYGTMLAGNGRFIMVGNRIAKDSVLALWAKSKGLYHTVVNITNENGEPSWPEVYSLKSIQEMRERMGERAFMRECKNSPVSEGAVFKEEWMRYTKPLRLRDYVRIVTYTDPSFKGTTKNDYKATITVAKTRAGEFHVLRAYAAQTSVKNMVSWHYDIDRFMRDKNGVCRYYMEANFIQELLLKEFKEEGAERGHHIAVTADKRKKPDKYARIEALQPLFERGLILFATDDKESPGLPVLIDQLICIEPGSRVHDDAPDALEGAIWMLSKGVDPANEESYYVPKRQSRKY